MKISLIEIISAVSGFAALLTAIIVFFTLIEMKRQRQSSYKPDLTFKPVHFSFSATFTDALQHKISSKKINGDSNKAHYEPSTEIYNVGLGSAKNLCVTWRFDYQKAIKLIKNAEGKFGLTISLENMLLQIKDKVVTWIEITYDLRQDIDYLLPASIANETARLLIPSSYVHLLSFYFIFHVYKNPDENILFNFADFPELKMNTKFNDIGGKTYSKKYKINPRRLSMQYNCNDDGCLSSINVDFLLEFNAD